MGAAWFPDPLGRHDHRLWSGDSWTDQVSDLGVQSADPIETVTPNPVTIRPSSHAMWARFQARPAWRRAVAFVALAFLVLLAFVPVAVYGTPGALLTGFALACGTVLPVLYFRVFYIRADQAGIEIRNQIGVRKLIPRDRIGLISAGRVWGGGSMTSTDFVFIVSPANEQLARFYLEYWEADDFRRVAQAIGLRLYGMPGRAIDEMHSGRAVQRTAMFLGGSMLAGAAIGFALPVLLGFALLVALILSRLGR